MTTTITLLPGITLRCFRDTRFKHGCLSLQLVRPMAREEAALNALIPAILLRGCATAPDLRAITLRLDDLYGASVSALVRRVGDYQTSGLYCSFVEDQFAFAGDKILEPMIAFLKELLLEPVLEEGFFRRDYVESEKKNLIATIESQLNDKRSYALTQMLRTLCPQDSYGIPRLGDVEQVRQATPETLTRHYRRILKESPVELFYVGSAPAEQVAALLRPLFAGVERDYVNLPAQTPFTGSPAGSHTQTMDVAQGKLAMGFVSPITTRDEAFPAMQIFNTLFGGGMTSKLFNNVREKHSLCYDIHSGYYGSKGILYVSAGIDCAQEENVYHQVLAQLEACCQGEISDQELTAAKEAVISSLRGVHDSPGAIESYYATGVLSGHTDTPAEYIESIRRVTVHQVSQAARTLTLYIKYFLRGEGT